MERVLWIQLAEPLGTLELGRYLLPCDHWMAVFQDLLVWQTHIDAKADRITLFGDDNDRRLES